MAWLRTATLLLWCGCICATVAASPSAKKIYNHFKKELSLGSEVYLLGNGNYSADLIQRWNTLHAPTYVVAVKPALESDVQKIVYSSRNGVPFMATGGGHGYTTTTGAVEHGIDIDLGFFDGVSVDAANNLMTIGGSVTFHDVFDPLYSAGKEIATGYCSCVGMVGATLGGGIGPLQGLYGLIVDALVSVRIVTGTGQILVASKTQNRDLFWAIRGGGMNFGIVTSATYQIHDLTNGGEVLIMDLLFVPERNASVFELLSSFPGNQPNELSIAFGTLWNPDLELPAILVSTAYFGPERDGMELNQAFLDIGPLVQNIAVVPWNTFIMTNRFGGDAPSCVKGRQHSVYGTNLYSLDSPNLEQLYESISDFYFENPELRATIFVADLFPPAVAMEIADEETAFPFRNTTAYTFLNFQLPDPSFEPTVDDFARPVRQALAEGGGNPGLEVYVNYAHGDEGPAAWYTRRKLPRLRELKRRWDPKALFNFSNGIVP
ncbi:hypothetical protein S40288_08910 [Stachybotrys chartarum IBT 40288]|nr:hypothetical protein S40288_08910 [Stachybotrys chartarum IBT 40288]